jgi:uncharacterized protein
MTVKYLLILSMMLVNLMMVSAQTYTVENVPNTKLVNNSYVSNPDNIINPSSVAEIDSILNDLENKSSVQVAVVLLNSIGEEDIFDFAQELFNHWGIGQKQNDNGLLILLVKDLRTVRFHTGNGIEGLLPDATCKDIQRDYMVPFFKEGDYDNAMVSGTRAVAEILNNPEVVALQNEILSVEDELPLYNLTVFVIFAWLIVALITFFVKAKRNSFVNSNDTSTATLPKAQFTAAQWFGWFIVVPVLVMIALTVTNHAGIFLGGLYAYMGGTALLRRGLMEGYASKWLAAKDYHAVYSYYQQKQSLFSAMRFLFPIPFAFMYGAYKRKMAFVREHPRECKQCGQSLAKLNEQDDNQFLSPGQVTEENLKSVDYDVWFCNGCKNQESFIYPNVNTKYSVCSKCNFTTYYLVSNRTIRSATTMSEGHGEEIKACKFCNHRDVRTYTIPKVVKSSSGSSSSSSSGGSWGGGRSGGGGASSSW